MATSVRGLSLSGRIVMLIVLLMVSAGCTAVPTPTAAPSTAPTTAPSAAPTTAPHLPVLGAYKIILAGLGLLPYAITGKAFDQAGIALSDAARPLTTTPPRRVQRSHELLRAKRLLDQNQVIYVPIDAAVGVGPCIYTPVGRRLFPFNVGVIELTLATDAPLLPVTTLLQPDNRLRLTIDSPLDTGNPQMTQDERV